MSKCQARGDASCTARNLRSTLPLPLRRDLRDPDLQSTRPLERLMRGDPVEAMEVAKQIIGKKVAVDPGSLEAILSDRKSRRWSRIAAIYTLGFLAEGSAVPALLQILLDHKEPIGVRAHAAEALGNIGETRAVPALGEILRGKSSPSLQKSCTYALEEIGGADARAVLQTARSRRCQSKPAPH